MPLGLDDSQDILSQNDGELNGFVGRFQSILSQITRETEEGLAFARLDSDTSSQSSSAGPSSASQYLRSVSNSLDASFNSFGSYRAQQEEHVRVLGGYVRRMPTIESLGSHEMSSIAHSSTHRAGGAQPSTRRNTLSSMLSSRTNSIHTNDSHHTAGGAVRWSMVANEVGETAVERGSRDDNDGTESGRSLSFHTAASPPASPLQSFHTAS